MKTEWQMLFVAIGGAMGALSRFGISHLFTSWLKHPFPIGTLIANLTGCFLMGMLIGSGGTHSANHTARLGIGVGFLGALTTFSTFGAETIEHVHQDEWLLAVGNISANLVLGLAAVVLGIVAGKKLFG